MSNLGCFADLRPSRIVERHILEEAAWALPMVRHSHCGPWRPNPQLETELLQHCNTNSWVLPRLFLLTDLGDGGANQLLLLARPQRGEYRFANRNVSSRQGSLPRGRVNSLGPGAVGPALSAPRRQPRHQSSVTPNSFPSTRNGVVHPGEYEHGRWIRVAQPVAPRRG